MSVVAAVATVAGLGISVTQANRQAKIQKEAGAVSSAAQKNEDASKLRSQARAARVQRSKILQAAESQGGGSRESGAISSLSTQLGEQQGRVSGQQATAETLGGLSQQIADSRVTQQAGSVLQQVGASAFNTTGGFDNLFKGS